MEADRPWRLYRKRENDRDRPIITDEDEDEDEGSYHRDGGDERL